MHLFCTGKQWHPYLNGWIYAWKNTDSRVLPFWIFLLSPIVFQWFFLVGLPIFYFKTKEPIKSWTFFKLFDHNPTICYRVMAILHSFMLSYTWLESTRSTTMTTVTLKSLISDLLQSEENLCHYIESESYMYCIIFITPLTYLDKESLWRRK